MKYRCKNPIEPVSAGVIADIHQKTLRVLETVGLWFEDDAVLDLLHDHGCDVDRTKRTAKIPAQLVARALQMAPSRLSLKSRDASCNIEFGTDAVQFGPCSGMQVFDHATGTLRSGTADDGAKTVRLTDALEIMAGANTGLGYFADRPRELTLAWHYALCCRNSGKVFCLGAMEDSLKWGIRMAEVANQDVIIPASSTSPLGWSREQIDAVKQAAACGRPVTLQSMASPGTTAPVTLTGAAVIMNAEILGMLVVAQLLQPGTGVIYSCFTLPMDMRWANLASGSIELSLLTTVSAQLSRFYRIGNMIWGPNTDAKQHDQQAGYEKGMQWLLAAQAGINLIWGAGMIENHTIWSDAQVIVDAEMCGMAGRFLEGLTADKDTDTVALIEEVGHFPKNFLAHSHTLEHFRGHHYMPIISSRQNYDSWVQQDPKELMARAAKLAKDLIEAHQTPQLAPDECHEVERLLAAAAQEQGLDTPLG